MGSITKYYRRKKIGGFQRLTSVLQWWLTAMGTKRKGGLTEIWVALWGAGRRRLQFEGRQANPPESTGVWLCNSQCFPSLILIPLLHVAGYPGHGFLKQLGRVIQAVAISLQSISDWGDGGNEMSVCWGKTASEEEENLFVFPRIPSFLQYSSSLLGNVVHIAIALRLVRLWIIVCMLIRIYWVLPLKWTKTLPLGIFNVEESTLFPLCLPLPFPKRSFVLRGVAADLLCSLCSLFPQLPEV